MFGVLAALILLSTRQSTARGAWVATGIAALYGVVDEVHQGFVPGRSVDGWDVCSDALGAGLAACLVRFLDSGSRRCVAIAGVLAVLAACSVHLAAR